MALYVDKIAQTVPSDVKKLISLLKDKGYECVLVGGCVRDSLLGLTPHDWDMATSATPEEMQNVFADFRTVDAGLKHGTLTVIIDHEPYEITTYRIDGQYEDFRRPKEVFFTRNLKDDIGRRDFTINSIAYDLDNGYYDFYDGMKDLESGVIRCVGNPHDRFNEDALRIIRAIRFACIYGFQIEEETVEAMIDCVSLLEHIAAERLQSEFSKILQSGRISEICHSDYFKVLETRFPFLQELSNKEKTYNIVDDLGSLESSIAVLFGDIIRDSRKYGISQIDTILRLDLRFPNAVIRKVENIIKCEKEICAYDVIMAKRLLSKYSFEEIESAISCKLSRIFSENYDEAVFERLNMKLFNLLSHVKTQKYIKDCYSLSRLCVDGNDIKDLGVPDKMIGKILNNLLDLVIRGQIRNDRIELLDSAKLTIL